MPFTKRFLYHITLIITALFAIQTDAYAQETESAEEQRAQTLIQKGIELYQAGRYQEAIPVAEEVLRIYEESLGSQHPSVATWLNNLAELHRAQGRYEEAEPLFRRALAIFEASLGPQHLHVAHSLNNLAVLYNTQGRYEEAEPLFRRALRIKEESLGPQDPDVATSLNNLAVLYKTQGRYGEAESLFRRALAIREESQGLQHPDVAQSLNNLAVLYKTQGRYGEAEPLYRRALAIREESQGPQHPDVASSLNNLAALYYTQGRYEEAEPLFRRALAIFEASQGPQHPDVASSLNNLAVLYDDQGRYREAEPLYRRALAIFEALLGPQHPHVAQNLNNLAALYYTQGRYREAEPLYRRALAIREESQGPQHPDVVGDLTNLAELYRVQGRYREAEPLLKRAHDNLFQQINHYFTVLSEKERERFYQTINFHFEAFNSFALEARKINPSISSEIYKNQLVTKALLLNSTAKVKRQILSSDEEDLITLYHKWIDQKEYLAKIYTLSKVEIAQHGINRDSLEAVTNDLEKQLSRRSQPFATARDTTLYAWQDIQQALNPEEAAVEMVRFNWSNKTWTDTVYYAALIVTPETKDYPEMVLMENGNDLEGKYFHEYLRCRKAKSELAYQQYWQPIKEKLNGIKKVYFSPDGIYNQINLNILPNPETGKYVLDEIDIHLVTNTKDILQFHKENRSSKQATLFGRPAYDLEASQHIAAVQAFTSRSVEPGWVSDTEREERNRANFSDLPGTETEVKQINQLLTENDWESTPYLGKAAIEEAVKAVDNPTVLHIATHGFFMQSDADDFRKRRRNVTPILSDESNLTAPVGGNPMLRSGLILAGAASYLRAEEKPDTEDGILTAYEAANLDLDNTELVVLSACETGRGEVRNGEGVYGLQRAFKVAGAKTILMSLWKVDDTATRELMSAFYEEWLKTGNKRQAFHKAQQQIREKYEKPEYWGAFVMVGE